VQIQVDKNHLPKECVMATKGNERNDYRKNLYMWAKMTWVSDVAHGPLVDFKI
jgi:hypothetical protein